MNWKYVHIEVLLIITGITVSNSQSICKFFSFDFSKQNSQYWLWTSLWDALLNLKVSLVIFSNHYKCPFHSVQISFASFTEESSFPLSPTIWKWGKSKGHLNLWQETISVLLQLLFLLYMGTFWVSHIVNLRETCGSIKLIFGVHL